jgi:hypothetical protein
MLKAEFYILVNSGQQRKLLMSLLVISSYFSVMCDLLHFLRVLHTLGWAKNIAWACSCHYWFSYGSRQPVWLGLVLENTGKRINCWHILWQNSYLQSQWKNGPRNNYGLLLHYCKKDLMLNCDLSHNSATMTYVTWHEECLWNVNVLQSIRHSNLVASKYYSYILLFAWISLNCSFIFLIFSLYLCWYPAFPYCIFNSCFYIYTFFHTVAR